MDDVKEILKVSEGRWQIEECFRIMKTDFSARPVYIRRDDRIEAHFLTCFLALLVYRLLEKQLESKYTCEEILDKLKSINFADIKGQGYMPTYVRDGLTDALHKICGFRTDYEFITKSDMRYPNGDEAHSICIVYKLRALSGELSCDNVETVELKYFDIDKLPEMFCKQHEEIKTTLKSQLRCMSKRDYLSQNK